MTTLATHSHPRAESFDLRGRHPQHDRDKPIFPFDPQGAADDEVRTQVWALLSTLYPKVTVVERRRETRYPFPFLIYLTPFGDDSTTPCGESIVVVGKHVSERGLGFYHAKPLAQRRVVASLERPHDGWYAFLLDLRWCRFTRQGWYESGGRFLEAVTSPLAAG
jgi:hypothetical protein